jgi:hypothetical protein
MLLIEQVAQLIVAREIMVAASLNGNEIADPTRLAALAASTQRAFRLLGIGMVGEHSHRRSDAGKVFDDHMQMLARGDAE